MSKREVDARIEKGMRAQFELLRARRDSGDEQIGWKVAFSSRPAMERLGTSSPLVGFLTRDSILDMDSALNVGHWTRPAAEPEIAIYLGRDLGEADRQSTRAAIAALGPAIEVADISFPPDDVEAILSGNIYHRHVVLGEADESRAGFDLEGLVGRVHRHGSEPAIVTDLQAVTGEVIGIIQSIAGSLARMDMTLRRGQVIICGSVVPPLMIDAPETLVFELDPIDTISLSMTAS